MGFGFSKLFAVVFIIAVAYAYYIRSWKGAIPILLVFAVIKLIWNILTQK